MYVIITTYETFYKFYTCEKELCAYQSQKDALLD